MSLILTRNPLFANLKYYEGYSLHEGIKLLKNGEKIMLAGDYPEYPESALVFYFNRSKYLRPKQQKKFFSLCKVIGNPEWLAVNIKAKKLSVEFSKEFDTEILAEVELVNERGGV